MSKPLILYPQEVQHALEHGKLTIARAMEVQPSHPDMQLIQIDNSEDEKRLWKYFWAKIRNADTEFYDAEELFDSPFGKVGEEFYHADEMGLSTYPDLTLRHTGTEVKRVQDHDLDELGVFDYDTFAFNWEERYGDKFPWDSNPWIFLGKFEVSGAI